MQAGGGERGIWEELRESALDTQVKRLFCCLYVVASRISTLFAIPFACFQNPDRMLSMRPVATDDPVAWCVCRARLRCAKTAERIEVLFGVDTILY